MLSNHTLEFVASMTVCQSDVRKIKSALEADKRTNDPLKNILVTPLFMSKGAINAIRGLLNHTPQRRMFFDSGGYYVQMGRLKYEDLYSPLMQTYRDNLWADVYVLPDHVPLSQDDTETVSRKVDDTVRTSSLFFYEMPDVIKDKAMPVVQGHTYKQVDKCLEAYLRLGVKYIGFGSFGTMGSNSQVNVATNSAIDMAKYVIDVAHNHGIKVHLFGLGVPALVAMLKGIQADSFDSSAWMKSAGFGQIYLPFMRAYNISYRNSGSEMQLGLSKEDFLRLKRLTGHSCACCEDINSLQDNKMARVIHNLIVISETVEKANIGDYDYIATVYQEGSPKYRNEFEKWLKRA
jgi:hypothetical protein